MGESLGIRAQMDDPDGKMEIIVAGTLSGSASPVGLELSMTKNLLLTVWKVVPNDSDELVVDSEADFTTLKEEENAIQYILRVAPGQENLLSIEGAKTYKDYLVALEGDTVTLRLNLPEGTESAGVYMDEAQTEQVSADETGAYTFTVPMAGGVVLSVKTK